MEASLLFLLGFAIVKIGEGIFILDGGKEGILESSFCPFVKSNEHRNYTMDLKLSKKTALVTASSAGIGFSIAQNLAEEGATVFINGRSEERVREAIDKIKQGNIKGEVLSAIGDAGTLSGVETLIAKIPEVDILINNLGIYEEKNFEEISDEEWAHFFEVNVMSGVRLSRHYFPKMKQRNWGRIIFISSESGVNIPVEMIHYGMTKTAQLAIARGLAEMTKETEVTVNSVLPGPTKTAGVEEFIKQIAHSRGVDFKEAEQELFNVERPSSLIRRLAMPDEVGAVVAFLCSPRAAAINGAAIRAEGGIVRSIV